MKREKAVCRGDNKLKSCSSIIKKLTEACDGQTLLKDGADLWLSSSLGHVFGNHRFHHVIILSKPDCQVALRPDSSLGIHECRRVHRQKPQVLFNKAPTTDIQEYIFVQENVQFWSQCYVLGIISGWSFASCSFNFHFKWKQEPLWLLVKMKTLAKDQPKIIPSVQHFSLQCCALGIISGWSFANCSFNFHFKWKWKFLLVYIKYVNSKKFCTTRKGLGTSLALQCHAR